MCLAFSIFLINEIFPALFNCFRMLVTNQFQPLQTKKENDTIMTDLDIVIMDSNAILKVSVGF
jgi:hypothetical protein